MTVIDCKKKTLKYEKILARSGSEVDVEVDVEVLSCTRGRPSSDEVQRTRQGIEKVSIRVEWMWVRFRGDV